jgi:transcription elongation factor GreB
MSRAFTKEDDAGEDVPEKPVPSGPNYVTPRGLTMLQDAARDIVARREKALAAGDEVKTMDRDLRYLEARIGSAIPVPKGAGDEARFGATVTLEDEAGQRRTFTIVGEDEARTSNDFMPWSAPLALAVMGARPGEMATWEAPEGVVRHRVVAVKFE